MTALLPSSLQLLQYLPVQASHLLEVRNGPSELSEHYLQKNPQANYTTLAEDDFTTITRHSGAIDCLIYDGTLESISESDFQRHLQCLKEGGMVVASVANMQYWQNLLALLRGTWSQSEPKQNAFTISGLREFFLRCGLAHLDGWPVDAPQPQHDEFLQTMVSSLEKLQIPASQFAMQTRATHFIVRALRQSPKSRLAIHTLAPNNDPCYRVRTLEPNRFLNTMPGIQATSSVGEVNLHPLPSDVQGVFIWQRSRFHLPTHKPMLRELLRRNYLLIAETDDDPRHWDYHHQTNFINFKLCHAVQTSTPPIGEFLQQQNPNVMIFPNNLLQIPNAIPEPRVPGRFDLFFGALNREQDWAPLLPTINATLKKYGEKIHVQVIYDEKFYQSIETPHKTFQPYCPYAQYLEILKGCAAAILPLNDNLLNNSKSDLKFLECAGHGVLALASPIVYERSLVDGETGMLFRSPEELQAHLEKAITDEAWRHQLIANAFHWVRNERMLANHIGKRTQWYFSLADRLPELNAQLQQRVPELFQD